MYIGQHKKDKERTTPHLITTCLKTEEKQQQKMDKVQTDNNNEKITKTA